MSSSLFENIWWWIIILSLALIVFLMMLNGFLRGRWKPYIDAVLGVIWFLLLIVSLIFYGWLIVLAQLIGSFIFGALIQPTTARIAARILKH